MDCPTKILLPKRIASTSYPFGNGQVEILGRTSDWSGLGQESTPWEGKVEHLDRQALQWIPSNSRVLLPKEERTDSAQPKRADACCERGHVRAISHLI